MPLSKPAPRKHIHGRRVACHGYLREDGLWDIEASLVDTKSYSFDNVDRGGINSGEPIHAMWFRLTVDDDRVVREAEAAIDAAPFAICGDIAAGFEALKGLRIAAGWRKEVRARFGGIRGCTHLTELLLGPLAAVANLTVGAASGRPATTPPPGDRPVLLDTCHALAADSPVVKREWPEFDNGS